MSISSHSSFETAQTRRLRQIAGNTAEHAADTALNYAKAEILANAGLTQGAREMVNLAQRYAPQGGSIEDITHAIRQGIGV